VARKGGDQLGLSAAARQRPEIGSRPHVEGPVASAPGGEKKEPAGKTEILAELDQFDRPDPSSAQSPPRTVIIEALSPRPPPTVRIHQLASRGNSHVDRRAMMAMLMMAMLLNTSVDDQMREHSSPGIIAYAPGEISAGPR